MFDAHHYVPIIRWKGGEIRAITDLAPTCRVKITPLLELTRDSRGDGDQIAAKIVRSWGKLPFFFSPGERTELEGDITRITEGVIAMGGKLIPTLSLSPSVTYVNALRPLAQAGAGVCLRIRREDLMQNGVESRIITLLRALAIRAKDVHCMVDTGPVGPEGVPFSLVYQRLPFITEWQTFTVVGGAFPINLTQFSVGIHRQPRSEWLSWVANKERFQVRHPSFGDYATLHPVLSGYFPGMNPSASIRYTAAEHWLVLRGQALRGKEGTRYEQYVANAAMLLMQNEFCQPYFSKGDAYIYKMAQGILKQGKMATGNPTEWLVATVNHHLTFVAKQLAGLP